MKRPRFTVRWLMILVALVAIALVGSRTLARWVGYRHLAAYHAGEEANYRARSKALRDTLGRGGGHWGGARQWAATYGTLADAHAKERAKYERASRRPWFPVDSD